MLHEGASKNIFAYTTYSDSKDSMEVANHTSALEVTVPNNDLRLCPSSYQRPSFVLRISVQFPAPVLSNGCDSSSRRHGSLVASVGTSRLVHAVLHFCCTWGS